MNHNCSQLNENRLYYLLGCDVSIVLCLTSCLQIIRSLAILLLIETLSKILPIFGKYMTLDAHHNAHLGGHITSIQDICHPKLVICPPIGHIYTYIALPGGILDILCLYYRGILTKNTKLYWAYKWDIWI